MTLVMKVMREGFALIPASHAVHKTGGAERFRPLTASAIVGCRVWSKPALSRTAAAPTSSMAFSASRGCAPREIELAMLPRVDLGYDRLPSARFLPSDGQLPLPRQINRLSEQTGCFLRGMEAGTVFRLHKIK